MGIALCMVSRVVVFTILPHIKSQYGDSLDVIFGQRLVFISLGGDLMGRFITIITPHFPNWCASTIVLSVALIQFAFLDVVLIYMFGDNVLPASDLIVQIVVAIFATLTGFLHTQSYAYAGVNVEKPYLTQVAAMMNVSTQVGNYVGLFVSFTLLIVFSKGLLG